MIPVTCDPEGKLDRVSLDEIEEFQGGLKSLGKTEYSKLKQSITEKGFVVPCFAWRNGSGRWKLLDGHQRVRVIRTEGWTIDGGIPVVEIVAENERDAKEKLLAIVSRYGRVEGQGLYEFLDGTGIDLEEWTVPDLPDLDLDSWLDEFIRDPDVPPGDPEAVPEVPEEATTQRGDLWVLGDHRVLCGDATSVDDVEKLMDGEVATLMVTDPPYNVAYGSTKADRRGNWSRGEEIIKNDHLNQSNWKEFCGDFCGTARVAVSGFLYVFHAPGPDGRIMATTLDEAFHWSASIVWVKNHFVQGRGKYQRKHEPLWFGWNGADGKGFSEDRTLVDVWDADKPSANKDHPTMKPLELLESAINHATKEGALTFDPFLGSGTTLIAAEKQGRRCFGLEIEPKYVDVIVKRWEDYTGKTAVIEQSKAA